MKPIAFFLFACFLVLVTACADSYAPASGNAGYDLEIAKGRATSAAIQTAARLAAEAIATGDARTAIAFSHESTRAAQAVQNAMLYAQATNTAQSQFAAATATAQWANARAAETAVVLRVQQTATQSTANANATATAERRTLEAQQQKAQATGTAQAIAAAIDQSRADNARMQTWKDYVDSILKIIVGVGSIAFLAMLIIYVARILDSMALRRRLIETREGTVILSIVGGKPTAQLVKPVPNLLDAGDEIFELPSETGQVKKEADEIKVRTSHGETFTMTREPDDTRRHLALRLLRDSIRHYQRLGFDPRATTRVATWRNLDWSADSWSKALDAIRPHVIVKQGRGGGVLCGEKYPNLLALYVAVGEHRAALSENGNARTAQTFPNESERNGSFRKVAPNVS